MSDYTQREELAELIGNQIRVEYGDATGADDAADAVLAAGWRRVGAVDDAEDVNHVEIDPVRSLDDIVRRYRFHSKQIVCSEDHDDAYLLVDVLRETWHAARCALTQDTSQTGETR
jgi:hypothetical protein